MNVYTPKLETKPKRLRPVMVYVHGGAFIMGGGAASDFFGPGLLIKQDVVVVTFNYRYLIVT